MTDELKAFLQDEDIKQLLIAEDFEKIFASPKITTIELFKELYETLKALPEEIFNKDEFVNSYYTFNLHRDKDKELFIKGKVKNNLYDYDFTSYKNRDSEYLVIAKGFEDSIKKIIDEFHFLCYPDRIQDIQYITSKPDNLIEVQLNNYYKPSVLITQECYNTFDEAKIKERRVVNAAKDEYNKYIKELLLKHVNEDKLVELLSPFKIDGDIDIILRENRFVIQFNYKQEDKDNILKLLKQNIKKPLMVMESPANKQDFMIIVDKKL